MIHLFISLFISANVKFLKVKCHCHKYCDIMFDHCRSLSFGLTRWHSWRSCLSRRPVSKVGLECWQNQFSTFSTWLIGLNQYFFKPYYSCSSTLTGTTENLIVVCTSPPCHSRWGPTPVPAQALQCFPHWIVNSRLCDRNLGSSGASPGSRQGYLQY